MNKKNKYLKKVIQFSGKKVTMFSIDGVTWSTRSEELEEIKARQELERASYGGQIKGGPQAKIPTTRPKITSVKNNKRPDEMDGEAEAHDPLENGDEFEQEAALADEGYQDYEERTPEKQPALAAKAGRPKKQKAQKAKAPGAAPKVVAAAPKKRHSGKPKAAAKKPKAKRKSKTAA